MKEEYIILNEDKEPAHQFKNGGMSWNMVKDQDNIGLIVPEPFVVLDFDTESDAKVMLNIVETKDIHCRVMKTDRGYHFWFRSAVPLKNFVKSRLAIGIYCDRKVCNKNAYVVIKRRGQMREWLRDYDEDDVDYLPTWLLPVDAPQRFAFKGMKAGDGRNQELLNYILFLQGKGFKKDDIRETLDIINEFVFDESMSQQELLTIMRDEVFKTDEELKQERADEKFNHEAVALKLLDEYHIISINGKLFVYRDGYYQPYITEISQAIIKYGGITRHQRAETIDYIKVIADKTEELENYTSNPYIINILNGRLDLQSGELSEWSFEYYDFCRIPIYYNPDAESKVLDDVLESIFCHDNEVIDLVEEIVANALLSREIYQKAFIFYGGGSNGKSTFFYLLRSFLGERNVSSVELEKVGDRFMTAELEHKLANIGDDLNYTSIRRSGTLKKLISGDSIQVERKNEAPYSYVSYATQIYACNKLPSTKDSTDGMMRRLCFIPCLAKFGSGGTAKNPYIKYQITEPEALSHLLNRAMAGLKRLLSNGDFTEPKIVKQAKAEYEKENNSVLKWIDEAGITLEYITSESRAVSTLYTEYKVWYGANHRSVEGCEKDSQFSRVMTKAFSVESVQDSKLTKSSDGKQRRLRFFKLVE